MKVFRLTVEEFLEKLNSGEIAMAPVLKAYPYGHLKAKNDLSAHDCQQLIEETDYLFAECTRNLPFVGGTRSSARVRRAKAHLETLITLGLKPNRLGVLDFMPLIEATKSALAVAKGSLAKHNAQPRKFVAYDPETGEPLNDPDYDNIDVKEIIESINADQLSQPTLLSRRERRKMKRRGNLQ